MKYTTEINEIYIGMRGGLKFPIPWNPLALSCFVSYSHSLFPVTWIEITIQRKYKPRLQRTHEMSFMKNIQNHPGSLAYQNKHLDYVHADGRSSKSFKGAREDAHNVTCHCKSPQGAFSFPHYTGFRILGCWISGHKYNSVFIGHPRSHCGLGRLHLLVADF